MVERAIINTIEVTNKRVEFKYKVWFSASLFVTSGYVTDCDTNPNTWVIRTSLGLVRLSPDDLIIN